MAAVPASVEDGERPLRAGANKPGLLTLTIKDKSALYLAYMPFITNGGLFIPTNSNYRIGDEVFMLLNLMGEGDQHAILRAESQEQTALIGTPNQIEAVMSNLQKRAAEYAD